MPYHQPRNYTSALVSQARALVKNDVSGMKNWLKYVDAVDWAKGYNSFAFIGHFINDNSPVPMRDRLVLLGITNYKRDSDAMTYYYFLIWGSTGLRDGNLSVSVKGKDTGTWAYSVQDGIMTLFNTVANTQDDTNGVDPLIAVSGFVKVVYQDESQTLVQLEGTPSDVDGSLNILIASGHITIFTNKALHLNGDATLVAAFIMKAHPYMSTVPLLTVNSQTVYQN